MPHEIVAVQRDVQRARRHVALADLLDDSRQAPRNRDAARPDPDERQVVEPMATLENLVGNAGQRSAHAVGIHYDGHIAPRTDT